MIIQEFSITGQHIERVNSLYLVADSRNFIQFRFLFSSEWAGASKTAVITTGGSLYNCMIDADGSISFRNMPVLAPGLCTVSVFGGDLFTTDACTMTICESGLKGGATPIQPPPDIYSQIVTLANGANVNANAAKLDAAKAKTDAASALIAANDTQNAAALAAKAAQSAQALTDADAVKTAADVLATETNRTATQKSATDAAAQAAACQTAANNAAADITAKVSAAIGVKLDSINGEVV